MAQTPTRTGMIKAGDAELYYEEYGEGVPLLLLHGWTQTSSFWQPFLEELSANHKVYVLDLHGHGKSGILEDDFSIQRAAADVADFIRSKDLAPTAAVGMSFGAILLLEIASANPDLLQSMVLIGAVYEFNGADGGRQYSWKEFPEDFQRKLLADHPEGPPQLDKLFASDTDYQVHLSPDDLQAIRIPALVIAGENDVIAGTTTAEELDSMLSDSRLWLIEGKGHIPFDDSNTEEFSRRVLRFIRSE